MLLAPVFAVLFAVGCAVGSAVVFAAVGFAVAAVSFAAVGFAVAAVSIVRRLSAVGSTTLVRVCAAVVTLLEAHKWRGFDATANTVEPLSNVHETAEFHHYTHKIKKGKGLAKYCKCEACQ